MPLVFLFYLLCAITDCPPPKFHENQTSPLKNLLRYVPSGDNRYTRSSNNSPAEFPVVSTSLGDVQGRFLWSRDGRKIAAFEGIPYALPPVGRLRFRDPVPLNNVPWKRGILVANKIRTDCLQLDFGRTLRVRGGEDCLYLNVYAPSETIDNSTSSLPVLIWIHGGGWMSHSGTIYGPRYLLDKSLILITFNYRIGVLGFLSTGDESARGNYGLKDQLAAFSWVVDHISSFGGNPNKITLIGESTGAGSAALHLISPLTSSKIPRFHGAILFSGSSFNHWATMNRATSSNTKLLAEGLQCPTQKSSKDLVECLRRRDPYMVVGQQLNIWRIPVISRLVFGPVVEENIPGAFLVEAPEEIYQSNQSSSKVMPVPVIAGINTDEGSLFAANVYLVPFLFNFVNAHWVDTMAFLMAYDNIPGVSVPEISKKISEFYFNGKMKWSYQNLREIGNALGDRTITTGVHSFLQKHSEVAPTFGYKFAHSGSSTLLKHMGLTGDEWGVSHGDELPLVFSMKDLFDDIKSPRDLAVSRFLVDVIATFAKDGRPVPTNSVGDKVIWNPVLNPEHMEILEIREEKKLVPFPFEERMKFWEKLNLN